MSVYNSIVLSFSLHLSVIIKPHSLTILSGVAFLLESLGRTFVGVSKMWHKLGTTTINTVDHGPFFSNNKVQSVVQGPVPLFERA